MTSLVANTAEEKRTPKLAAMPARPRFQMESTHKDYEAVIRVVGDTGPGNCIAIVCGGGPAGTLDTREAVDEQAAFIVLACNSFDALTEANKKMREALEIAEKVIEALAPGMAHVFNLDYKLVNDGSLQVREALKGAA